MGVGQWNILYPSSEDGRIQATSRNRICHPSACIWLGGLASRGPGQCGGGGGDGEGGCVVTGTSADVLEIFIRLGIQMLIMQSCSFLFLGLCLCLPPPLPLLAQKTHAHSSFYLQSPVYLKLGLWGQITRLSPGSISCQLFDLAEAEVTSPLHAAPLCL